MLRLWPEQHITDGLERFARRCQVCVGQSVSSTLIFTRECNAVSDLGDLYPALERLASEIESISLGELRSAIEANDRAMISDTSRPLANLAAAARDYLRIHEELQREGAL